MPNSSQICAKPASKVSHILCDLLTSKFPPQQRRIKAPVQLPNHPLAATFPSLVVDPKPQKLTRTVEQTPGDLIAQISMIARGNLCLPLSPPRLRWLNSSKERWRVAINSESLNCHKKLSTTQAGEGATIRRHRNYSKVSYSGRGEGKMEVCSRVGKLRGESSWKFS